MVSTKLNIGKIPISKGEYQEGTAYQRLNQVTMLGSTYQSKIDDNTSAPAQMGADGAVENINTDKWLCIAVGNVSAAKKVVYNNETSGLDAGNVQEAIDEVGSKVSDLSLKVPVVSLFDYNNVTIGKSINPSNGSILNVIKAYKLVKLHLSAGKYWIYSGCGSSSQATLWKYSDNGYASPEKEIVGSTGTTPYNQILTLEEGYYAFCWNDNNGNGFSLGNAFITDNMSISVLIDDKVENGTKGIKNSLTNVENMLFKPSIVSVFDKSDIIVGKYLNPTNKTISAATKNYKLVKLHLLAKKYWLYIKNEGGTQGILWKFTDETFSSVESEIIGAAPSSTISKILTLDEGYYAFCWNDGSPDSILPNRAFFTDNISTQMLIDNAKDELKQEINSSAKSYGNLISDFSDFDILNNAFSISEDKASAQSLLTGYENRLQYNTNLYEDKFILSSTLKIIDTDSLGYFEFCIGFWYQLAGTMFGIGKDENGSYISVYIVGQTLPPKQTHKYYISELVFVKGKEYTISIEKKTEKNSYFNISVTAQDGISVSKDGIGNGEVISGDTANEGNGSINGYAWGKLSFYALIGKMRVSNVCFGYPIDMNDVKLVIVGHSFIEGNSIPSDKDKRFASLLCSSIGDRKTIILGQGGASVSSIKPHIDKEMKWLKDARYVLFCIGTNDIDSQATCTGLQYIDDAATKNGIRTIWLTVPPKYGTGDNHPVINDYIRSHFRYVEIKDVFYNNDGVLDKNMFLSDNIHPSIEGHKRIYNLIKARCSFLKTI
jgi:lysophospholipase L1-like esterase